MEIDRINPDRQMLIEFIKISLHGRFLRREQERLMCHVAGKMTARRWIFRCFDSRSFLLLTPIRFGLRI